jgi:Acyl-CoA thioesterase N-terminal domain/Acyl-CoA thioesterase C-terminal domain
MAAEPTDTAHPSPLAGSAGTQAAGTGEGFFRADGDELIPSELSSSPWGPVLHGRLIGGLTARAVEQVRATDPDLVCTRLTIDMFRSAPLSPMRVSTRTIRTGRRITVLEVTVEQEKGPIGQGKVVLLRRSVQPEGAFRTTPEWDAPPPGPALGALPTGTDGKGLSRSGYRFTAPWQAWSVAGPSGPRSGGIWARDVYPLIEGEDLTPLVRVAMLADLSSPQSNSSGRGLPFINADYTLYLGREPQGEYFGIQPYGHVSDRGVAVGQCVVHDEKGPLGFVSTTAVANA